MSVLFGPIDRVGFFKEIIRQDTSGDRRQPVAEPDNTDSDLQRDDQTLQAAEMINFDSIERETSYTGVTVRTPDEDKAEFSFLGLNQQRLDSSSVMEEVSLE